MARNYLLDSVASRVSSLKSSHTIRVAIDGVDAAGKTTLADELADRLRQLGRLVVRSGIDGFHRPRQDRYARGFDCPEGYYHDSYPNDDDDDAEDEDGDAEPDDLEPAVIREPDE